ncbi:17 kDa surface antigen [Ferrimonas balearica DSM 9799]|uniref:17 kDa surface antigen n=1 Tax=Ferrimonas balearica (strain DSM 9799 / CCM 4581 / KCTC 23876 / PAT) TaxID=550540 RepID=E1STS3_FERBD|nr:glycine zipper 2TM domain-containing protein [Ferrimonas balearica]ADN76186.1 17 kDa surface antigen [Ferrimonas balearica DSM 9799]MBY6016671.1 glycine zipper 2TM domain-containing protein [Halomonas denitrificans]MBW3139095.1 glycine zipper 2TM domain-containing protein [Ferrimonas balearica]MBW3163313.1 glycine zipper 2TM domain-containing protein [Ferrimonas balearica]MBY6106157.1 glycine zipper 2TM domain-containing protein [Ferrimonas balearica]
MLTKRLSLMLIGFILAANALANYNRNQAVPVEKVVYGAVESVREISREELIEDRNRGWKVFGGAVLGGVIGHQFGGGSGQDVATVLGALAGAGLANRSANQYQVKQYRLVELMIQAESGEQVMVIQDFDPGMVFRARDQVRIVYLAGGQVRVDKAM